MIRKTLPALLVALAPVLASASPVFEGQAPAAAKVTGLRVADASAAIADRRLAHYGLRVLQSVADMANEEADYEGKVHLSNSTLRTLRVSLNRFLESGERSGYSEADMAAALQTQYEQVYQGRIPIALRGSDGRLDALLLVESAIEYRRVQEAQKSEQTYMAQLELAAPGTDKPASSAPVLDARIDTAKTEPAAPVAVQVADLPPEYAEIMERIDATGGNRRITVQRGDTLGLIARAVYGDTLKYRDIFELNAAQLSNPDNLRVGLVLSLPPS